VIAERRFTCKQSELNYTITFASRNGKDTACLPTYCYVRAMQGWALPSGT